MFMCPNSVQNENRAKFLFHASEQRMKKDRDIKQRQKTVKTVSRIYRKRIPQRTEKHSANLDNRWLPNVLSC